LRVISLKVYYKEEGERAEAWKKIKIDMKN
jgi:hypothetical protein